MKESKGTGMTLWRLYEVFSLDSFNFFLAKTVKRNQQQYGIPLVVVSYEELYGWSMDTIVREIGLKNNCNVTFKLDSTYIRLQAHFVVYSVAKPLIGPLCYTMLTR